MSGGKQLIRGLHNPPSNDVCRRIDGGYLDVIWNGRNRTWRADACGKHLGYWLTKRRAKKAAIRFIESQGATP